MSELYARTVAELSEELRTGRVSSVELTRLFLARSEQYQGELNAFITLSAEAALAEAARADERLRAGPGGPLTGIPMAHKDTCSTHDERTGRGARMLPELVSPYDATVVERRRAAGAVMLGKADMDEFAMGSSNETSFFGPV